MLNLSMNLIIAQIIGVLAILTFAISPHQKTKKRVLVWETISNIFYALQYLFLGAFSAAATNFIGIIKNLIFYQYTNKDKKIPLPLLILYITIIIIAGIFTFNNILSIIPIVLSILVAYGVWQNNLKVYRFIYLISTICWLIYNFIVGAYVGVIGNFIQLFSAIMAIIRIDIKKNK